MLDKGVKVELFGSMNVGNVHQYSDIDLLVIDRGNLGLGMVLSEIEHLAGDIPVDVTFLECVPKRSLELVLESLNANKSN